jgi:hypothetical protein
MLQPRVIALAKLLAGMSLTSASVGETGLWINAHIGPVSVALADTGKSTSSGSVLTSTFARTGRGPLIQLEGQVPCETAGR